jgi:cob(I)alamin adenosyltransferase
LLRNFRQIALLPQNFIKGIFTMSSKVKQGLLIVHTGNGKGKSTAAFGMVLRAWGRGFCICVIQFIKAETGQWGEVRAAQKLGIEWHIVGDGFTWTSTDMDETIAHAHFGWELAKEKISSGTYDLIVLDEFTYPLHFGWIDITETLAWLKANRPSSLHLIITGRNAPQALLDQADVVTDMRLVKHSFDQGIKAQPGIEF